MHPRPMPRFRCTAILLWCIAAACAATAHAGSRVAQVEVHDRTAGEPLAVYRKFGERWIVGERGHEYTIRVRNDSNARVLAVISVDGVNAVTGQTASPSQSGYVIEPGESVTVEGWRKSLERTAAFVFTTPSRAYAARTHRPDNIGVIGVALFRERERYRVAAPAAETGDAQAAQRSAAKSAGPAAPSLGTGHGRSEYSPAQWTAFERESDTPSQVVVLRYESRDSLMAMGVLPRERVPRDRPDPFPAAFGFVPDP